LVGLVNIEGVKNSAENIPAETVSQANPKTSFDRLSEKKAMS
jgi:hypothetical protein